MRKTTWLRASGVGTGCPHDDERWLAQPICAAGPAWFQRLLRAARRLFQATTAGAVALAVQAAPLEDGLTSDTVTISRVIALQGPAGAKGREQEEALQAYFASVNSAGGIHGRKIVLRTTDLDLRTDAALSKLYAEQRPFAFFLFGGTVGSTIAMTHATQHQVPFVAPNSGAIAFHQPPNRYVFNVRARYQDEVLAAVRQFATVNQRRLATVYVDDPFGRDAVEGFREGMRSVPGVTAVYEGKLAAQGGDLAPHIEELVRAKPDAVIAVGASKRIAELIREARKRGVAASFMTLSNNASAGFAEELGEYRRGVIVGQVTPPGTGSSRLGRELFQLMSKPPNATMSYASMEAYVAARVLVEGLRRAGPGLSREGFVKAMESMKRMDLGGMEVEYGPTRRSGSNYVDLSILSHDGRYVR